MRRKALVSVENKKIEEIAKISSWNCKNVCEGWKNVSFCCGKFVHRKSYRGNQTTCCPIRGWAHEFHFTRLFSLLRNKRLMRKKNYEGKWEKVWRKPWKNLIDCGLSCLQIMREKKTDRCGDKAGHHAESNVRGENWITEVKKITSTEEVDESMKKIHGQLYAWVEKRNLRKIPKDLKLFQWEWIN